ncbi:MAG TPA: hypothetical protein VKR06_08485, partial [Ktedonosporobacter sp.]|nr:hypothetical protein [Ktedonosporobacter sp.]
RYVPRRHPAAMGGWSACCRVRADPRSCAVPTPDPAIRGGAGGVSSGLAGLCALVTTARASLRTLPWQGKPRAPPNRSRVSSLETALIGHPRQAQPGHCVRRQTLSLRQAAKTRRSALDPFLVFFTRL